MNNCFLSLQAKKGDILEIFFINEGSYGRKDKTFDMTDAIHVHGYSFYVIAQQRHGVMNGNVKMIYDDEAPKGMHQNWSVILKYISF